MRRVVSGLAVVLACAGALSACAGLLGLDDIVYSAAPDSAVDQTAADDVTNVVRPVVTCDAGPNALDLAGCPCQTNNEMRTCYHGIPGPKSQCRQGGTQTCVLGVWSGCVGASAAAKSDTCFDDIDNDCNGIVDDGCLCAPGSDMCLQDAGTTLDAAAWHIYTVPSQPLNGVPFDLYVVGTTGFLRPKSVNIALTVTPEGGAPTAPNGLYCWGNGWSAPCPSVGATCESLDAGWYAVRHHLTIPATGQVSVYVFPSQSDPCAPFTDQANATFRLWDAGPD